MSCQGVRCELIGGRGLCLNLTCGPVLQIRQRVTSRDDSQADRGMCTRRTCSRGSLPLSLLFDHGYWIHAHPLCKAVAGAEKTEYGRKTKNEPREGTDRRGRRKRADGSG